MAGKKNTPHRQTLDVKELAADYTEAAIHALAKIMLKGETESSRVAAAKELLDRGHGKSRQPVDATVKASVTVELVNFSKSDIIGN